MQRASIGPDYCSINSHWDTGRVLLEKGVDANTKYGGRGLHAAASSGHEPTVRLLLEKGIDVEVNGRLGQTVLQSGP
jgi:ankyrin repeat protein